MIFCQQCGGETGEREHDGKVRPTCTRCGAVTYLDPKLAVAVLIEREGKILLGRRGPGSRESGRWSFPAGFVERGERPQDAAIREVQEEVGLEITTGELLGLYSSTGEPVVLAVYVATEATGEPLAADDLDAVDWFLPDALPELAFPHDVAIVQQWRQSTGPR